MLTRLQTTESRIYCRGSISQLSALSRKLISMVQEITAWFRENRGRLALLSGVFLVGVLAFEAGLLLGKMRQEAPLLLSLPPSSSVPALGAQKTEPGTVPLTGAKGTPVNVEPVAATVGVPTNCIFVGSKNSNKYHLPTCTVAKRIKPENRVCFASKEEAEKRGYVPSCLK